MLVLVHHHIEIHIRTAVFAVVQIEQGALFTRPTETAAWVMGWRVTSPCASSGAGVLQRDPGPRDGCGSVPASAWITSQSINRVFSPRVSMSMGPQAAADQPLDFLGCPESLRSSRFWRSGVNPATGGIRHSASLCLVLPPAGYALLVTDAAEHGRTPRAHDQRADGEAHRIPVDGKGAGQGAAPSLRLCQALRVPLLLRLVMALWAQA